MGSKVPTPPHGLAVIDDQVERSTLMEWRGCVDVCTLQMEVAKEVTGQISIEEVEGYAEEYCREQFGAGEHGRIDVDLEVVESRILIYEMNDGSDMIARDEPPVKFTATVKWNWCKFFQIGRKPEYVPSPLQTGNMFEGKGIGVS